METKKYDIAEVRKQLEYYMSDENLKRDEFFHDMISKSDEVWNYLQSNLYSSSYYL